MSKVRVFELANEMGLDSSVVEDLCRELGIEVKDKHLTHLSSEDVVRVRGALREGPKRASAKDTRVDSTVVRRRRKNEDDKPAAPVVAAAPHPSTQVAGGAGAVATSATTVRRRKAVTEDVELPRTIEVRQEAEAPVTQQRAAVSVEPEPMPEPMSEPEAESDVEETFDGQSDVLEAEPATPPVSATPARPDPSRTPTDDRAVIVARPQRRVSAATGSSRLNTGVGARPSLPTPPVVTPPEPAPARAGEVPAAASPGASAERQVAVSASPTALPSPGPQTPAERASAIDANRQSLVQVVRRVDDAIMQNLLNDAQRRADRQARGPMGGGRPMPGGNFQGPGGPGGPGGPASRRGLRPGEVGPPANTTIPAPGTPGAPGLAPRKPGEPDEKRGRVAWEKHKDKSFDDRVMRMRAKRGKSGGRDMHMQEAPVSKAPARTIKMEETITVGELASQLSVKASEVIKTLMQLGEMVTVNHVLDIDTVSLLSQDYNFKVENVAFDIENYIPKIEDVDAKWVSRDPVVTVMGHVDHGKTSLLDHIRKTRVAAGEAGGITQHMGAYKVPVVVNGQKRHVVFLDTPGHAAFSAMRARGAQVTDVVILVVAADDGVMPQTIEAVNHAKAAGVPIVVAVNKIDKADAKPEKVRQQLTEHGVVSEEWGGEAQFINVSAKSGQGIDQLLESVCLQADVLELKAIENRPAKGVVIEAELSKGRGPVATILVQEGTLKRGDIVVAGRAMGRVRALIDDRGKNLGEAGPATPVEVLGMDSVPPPSERFYVVKDEKDAKAIVSHLEDKDREKRLAEERKKLSLDDLFQQIKTGEVKNLNLVIKSDVQGSLEALRTAFLKLKHPELEVRIIHDAVGAISESDVNLASASNAIIIAFNVRPEKNAKTLAEQEKVEIKMYSVIYNAVDDVKAAMEGMLKPNIEEKFVGRAAVREVFSIPKFGSIAGCAVLQGKLVRGQRARLIRDGKVIFDAKLDSLRRFKDNAAEVDRGHECGAHLENYNDVKVGDEIECYELIEIAQKLELTL